MIRRTLLLLTFATTIYARTATEPIEIVKDLFKTTYTNWEQELAKYEYAEATALTSLLFSFAVFTIEAHEKGLLNQIKGKSPVKKAFKEKIEPKLAEFEKNKPEAVNWNVIKSMFQTIYQLGFRRDTSLFTLIEKPLTNAVSAIIKKQEALWKLNTKVEAMRTTIDHPKWYKFFRTRARFNESNQFIAEQLNAGNITQDEADILKAYVMHERKKDPEVKRESTMANVAKGALAYKVAQATLPR